MAKRKDRRKGTVDLIAEEVYDRLESAGREFSGYTPHEAVTSELLKRLEEDPGLREQIARERAYQAAEAEDKRRHADVREEGNLFSLEGLYVLPDRETEDGKPIKKRRVPKHVAVLHHLKENRGIRKQNVDAVIESYITFDVEVRILESKMGSNPSMPKADAVEELGQVSDKTCAAARAKAWRDFLGDIKQAAEDNGV